MSMDPGIDDLIQGGAAAFSFENMGDTCRGEVVHGQTKQQTDINTGEPKFFPSGDPMMQIVVTVRQDDGEEAALYFRGGNFKPVEGEGKSSLDALRGALDGNKLEVGGTLALQFSGLGEKGKAAHNPPKLYKCSYKPPVASIPVTDDLI